METYVIWDNDEQAFFSERNNDENYFTQDLDSACHYPDEVAARIASEELGNPVVLRWM